MTYTVERLCDTKDEIAAILPLHWDEIGGNEEFGPLDLDWSSYLAMEQAGLVHLLLVRDRAVLVGYCLTFLRPHLHSQSVLTAYNDYYFLLPSHRKGFTGVTMFREVEKSWRKRGVQVALIACKTYLDHGVIFERLGWKFREKAYLKDLRATA